MRTIAKLALVTLSVSATSCSSGGSDPETYGQRQDPIYYGSVDNTHQAVVEIVSGGGLCSGTIIERRGSYAYVLTAAHCVTNAGPTAKPAGLIKVLQGDDYNFPSESYDVDQVGFHPLYDGSEGSANDFGMLRISGASSSMQTIPAMTPAQDKLDVNTQMDLVGYGRTESDINNSVRRHVVKPIKELYGAWMVFDQSGTSGGTCGGDSGGPALSLVTELVAGVTSFGSGASCTESGYAGRVSTVYNSFIRPFIDGTTGTISCDECNNAALSGTGACVSVADACFKNSNCDSFYDCLAGCTTPDCQEQCVSNNPTGADMYDTIGKCICNTCDAACANDPRCQVRDCGFTMSDPTCNTCSEKSCCNESIACSNDPACVICATSADPPATCASNKASKGWKDCLGQKCANECKTDAACGFSTSDSVCQTCFEDNCCAEADACSKDQTCIDCFGASTPPAGCDANAVANGFLGCLASKCGTECGVGGGSGGSGGSAGTGGEAAGGAGTAGSGGGSSGSPANPRPRNTSGDSGGCATSTSSGSTGGAGALILLGAALACLRRRRALSARAHRTTIQS